MENQKQQIKWKSCFRDDLFLHKVALVTGEFFVIFVLSFFSFYCFLPSQRESASSLFSNSKLKYLGGGTGIGRSIAKELALLGATVVISSRDSSKNEIAAEELNEELKLYGNSTGGKVVAGPPCSIRKEEDVENLVRYAFTM